MKASENNGLIFSIDFKRVYNDRILHALCTRGSLSFMFRHIRYNAVKGDYVIVSEMPMASDFSISSDFEGYIMWLALDFFKMASIRSNYDVVGKLSLMQNPIMKLADRDYAICLEELSTICKRLNEPHLFRNELLGSLLAVHVLDLYDIHSRQSRIEDIPDRAATLMHKFIELLQSGEARNSRELSHYSSQLYITPHYLSEISRTISGKPAGYWIDRFAVSDILREVADTSLTLSTISERFYFRSLSHFSRYFSAKVGMTPTQYRNSKNKL